MHIVRLDRHPLGPKAHQAAGKGNPVVNQALFSAISPQNIAVSMICPPAAKARPPTSYPGLAPADLALPGPARRSRTAATTLITMSDEASRAYYGPRCY